MRSAKPLVTAAVFLGDSKERLVVTALTNAIDGPAESILSGIYRIIDFFEAHESPTTARDWSMLEGTYNNLWGSMKIVAVDDTLVTIHSQGWDPMAMVEKLEWVEGDTFRIVETRSGGSEGELVHFYHDGGRVTRVEHSGSVYLPKEDWREKMAARSSVGY